MNGQLDLFTDWAELTCPACGGVEANAYTLGLNHGPTPGNNPAFGDQCSRQVLLAHHITSAVRRDDNAMLITALQRGQEAGLDVRAIIAETRQLTHERKSA